MGDRNGPLPQQELTIDGLNPDDSQHVIKEKTNHAGNKMRSIETNKSLVNKYVMDSLVVGSTPEKIPAEVAVVRKKNSREFKSYHHQQNHD